MDPTTLDFSAPVWADDMQSAVNITLVHPVFGPIPFTCDPTDTGAGFDTSILFARITAAGGIAPYVAPPAPPATTAPVTP